MSRGLRFNLAVLLLSAVGMATSQAAGSSGFPSPGRQKIIRIQCTVCASRSERRKPAARKIKLNWLSKQNC